MSKKGSNIFLIASVVIAVLMLGGAVLYARMGGQAPAISPGFTGEEIAVPESEQACAPGDRCIVVDTHCGFCCKYVALNGQHEQAFNTAFDRDCSRYKGQSCSCHDLSSYPSCVEGKCRLVKWPDEKK